MSTPTRTRAGLALAAIAMTMLAVCILAGCSSNSIAPDSTPDPDVHYFARTTPDSVMANLRLAYENRELEPYLDCLASNFMFYPSPGTLAENEWIPEYWGKFEEWQIHTEMFEYGFVTGVALGLLPDGEPVEIPGPTPEDPVSYEYTMGIDLRVDCPDSIQYVATAPSLFILRVDPDTVGPSGETLWEIQQWFDMDDDSASGRPVLPTTWGELKALFLPIDH